MWQTDGRTDRQNYDSQDRPRICSRGKNGGLDQYDAGPSEQQQFGTAGIEYLLPFAASLPYGSFNDLQHTALLRPHRTSDILLLMCPVVKSISPSVHPSFHPYIRLAICLYAYRLYIYSVNRKITHQNVLFDIQSTKPDRL